LDAKSNYSMAELQLILGAWVLSTPFERRKKISTDSGNVSEDDYNKRSIYSLLYSLYRSMGVVRSETGEPYEFTFNTWGYARPKGLGPAPTSATDPQRFGKNAYAGLFEFAPVKQYVAERNGRVHVVEMGCGTGAGAHHVCKNVLPQCTYHAFDMQQAAIETCRRKFVPELGGRLVAKCADCTRMPVDEGAADLVAVCETHVTEHAGRVTAEDQRFFTAVHRGLKPGGFLVWGNAIPASTWQPCFDYLATIGMKLVEQRDVTEAAILARDEDRARVDAYLKECIDRFVGFRIPVFGRKKQLEARRALENFSRNPGTHLYERMKDGTDSYRVALVQKVA
jgi:SAM-dependent methyltransferase